MMHRAIVDTGFLVALLRDDDLHHEWANALLPSVPGPWCTAEACITEALYLLASISNARETAAELLQWVTDGLLDVRQFLPEELEPVRNELFRYRDRWVDFADACVVCLSDQYPKLPVVSVDANDFAVYFRQRANRRVLVPTTPRRKRS